MFSRQYHENIFGSQVNNNYIYFFIFADPISCLWNDCEFIAPSLLSLVKHACFHGYHSKLKNIGENVLSRTELPPCNFSNIFLIPEQNVDYNCEWEDCNVNFLTIYEFFEHIRYHVNSNPKYCRKGEFIKCEWSGMNLFFSITCLFFYYFDSFRISYGALYSP